MTENTQEIAPSVNEKYELILGHKTDAGITRYYVKLYDHKYGDSVWLTQDEMSAEPNGNTILSKYQRNPCTKPPYYDPRFDHPEQILFESNGKYLVSWQGLDLDDVTWEDGGLSNTVLNDYRSRRLLPFAQAGTKTFDTVTPFPEYHPSNLKPREEATRRYLLQCYEQGYGAAINAELDMNPLKAVVAYFETLHSAYHAHGPFIITCDPIYLDDWVTALMHSKQLVFVKYTGSDGACGNARRIFFGSEQYYRFHVILTTTEISDRDSQYLEDIHFDTAVFHTPTGMQAWRDSNIEAQRHIIVSFVDAGHSPDTVSDICNLIQKKSRGISNSQAKKSRETFAAVQPLIQRMHKSHQVAGNQGAYSIIDCPPTAYQRQVCCQIVHDEAERLQKHDHFVMAGKISRALTDPAICGFPTSQPSTKLQVVDYLVHTCTSEAEEVLIVSQYQSVLDMIGDSLLAQDIIFDRITTLFEKETHPSEPLVYLYNSNYDVQYTCNATTVILVDISTARWKEVSKNFKTDRGYSLFLSDVYILQAARCCEGNLVQAVQCDADKFNENRASLYLKAAITECMRSAEDYDPAALVAAMYSQYDERPNIMLEILRETGDDFWEAILSEASTFEPQVSPVHEEWSVVTRDKFIRNLFRFGWGQWEKIAPLTQMSVSDVVQCARAVLRQLLSSYPSSQMMQTYLSNATNEEADAVIDDAFMTSTVFGEKAFTKFLSSNASAMIKRLEAIHNLRTALDIGNATFEAIPQFHIGGTNLTSWWTDEHDKILALGTYCYGFGFFDEYAISGDIKLRTFFNRFISRLDEQRLVERAMRLCESAKKVQMSEAQKIKLLMTIDAGEGWSDEEKEEMIKHLVAFGIPTEATANHTDAEVLEFATAILEQSVDNGQNAALMMSTINHIKLRIEAMTKLKDKLIGKKSEAQMVDDMLVAQKWSKGPKKWSALAEVRLLRGIAAKGWGHIDEILTEDDTFAEIIDNGIPAVLTSEETLFKRISMLADPTKRPVQAVKKKMSGTPKKSSNSFGAVPSLDELANGEYSFPIPLTPNAQLLDLGTVKYSNKNFWSARYLYNPGFKSRRQYNSIKDPNERIWYMNEIVDGGDHPIFKVYPEDDPDSIFEGETTSGPWVTILKAVSKSRGEKNKACTISGPEAFQLASPITSFLMQNMPNVDKCRGYIPKAMSVGVKREKMPDETPPKRSRSSKKKGYSEEESADEAPPPQPTNDSDDGDGDYE